jgi:hypothetical protein
MPTWAPLGSTYLMQKILTKMESCSWGTLIECPVKRRNFGTLKRYSKKNLKQSQENSGRKGTRRPLQLRNWQSLCDPGKHWKSRPSHRKIVQPFPQLIKALLTLEPPDFSDGPPFHYLCAKTTWDSRSILVRSSGGQVTFKK